MKSHDSFRFDRTVTTNVVHPMLSRFGSKKSGGIPILMYHGIRDSVEDRHPYFETNTRREVFGRHMQFLHEHGFVPVHLAEAVAALQNGPITKKLVVITFDDGFRDFYSDAFPILAQYGFKATMFIISGMTGERPSLRNGVELMSWPEVREIHKYGIEIGSHTVSHPELVRLPEQAVEHEVRMSKTMIENGLGAEIFSFAYPYAFPEHSRSFVDRLRRTLESAGYSAGVSTIIGTASRRHDKFFLPRLPANSYDDLKFFRAKLERGYDWLHIPQMFYKSLKSGVATWIQ